MIYLSYILGKLFDWKNEIIIQIYIKKNAYVFYKIKNHQLQYTVNYWFHAGVVLICNNHFQSCCNY